MSIPPRTPKLNQLVMDARGFMNPSMTSQVLTRGQNEIRIHMEIVTNGVYQGRLPLQSPIKDSISAKGLRNRNKWLVGVYHSDLLNLLVFKSIESSFGLLTSGPKHGLGAWEEFGLRTFLSAGMLPWLIPPVVLCKILHDERGKLTTGGVLRKNPWTTLMLDWPRQPTILRIHQQNQALGGSHSTEQPEKHDWQTHD